MTGDEKPQKQVDADKNADRRREEKQLRLMQLISFCLITLGAKSIEIDKPAENKQEAKQ